MAGPFDAYLYVAWPYQYKVEFTVANLHGGTPRDPKVVENWLRAKAGFTDDLEIAAEVARIFAVDPTVSDEQAVTEATRDMADRHVNGFKPVRRNGSDEIHLEGRHLKACLKEAVSICRAADLLDKKYGTTGKGIISFAAEHIMVQDDILPLGRTEHDDLHTRFISTRFGSGITVEEVVYDAKVSATIMCDYAFTEKEWAVIWLHAQEIGIGASRSQGFGKFHVTEWTLQKQKKN